MPLTSRQLLEQLVELEIVAAADAQALPFKRQPAPQALLEELIRQGKLTQFQAVQALRGQAKDLLLGKYLLIDKLGAGGMGQVYRAQHRHMKRMVAVKVMSAALLKDQDAARRFHREVEAAAQLVHPNIVTAHDADLAGNRHFLVMELVAGVDLSQLVKRQGPLEVARAVDYACQAARGLAYAHGQGIVHRDIKPANLLCSDEGVIKILDLGLARRFGEGDSPAAAALTNSGAIMGTIDYMSPEQAHLPKSADAKSDQYSLGCTLWFLLTGRPIFEEESLLQRLMAHKDKPAPQLGAARDDIPAPLEEAFQRMVAKAPAERLASMEEVVEALEGILQEVPALQAADRAGRGLGANTLLPAQRSVPGNAGRSKPADLLAETLAIGGVGSETFLPRVDPQTRLPPARSFPRRGIWVAAGFMLLLAGIGSGAAIYSVVRERPVALVDPRADQGRSLPELDETPPETPSEPGISTPPAGQPAQSSSGLVSPGTSNVQPGAAVSAAALPSDRSLATLRSNLFTNADAGFWAAAHIDARDARIAAPDDHLLWFYDALTLLKLGDGTGYQQLCAEMLTRFGGTTDPNLASGVAQIAALGPDGVPPGRWPSVRGLAKLADEAEPRTIRHRERRGAVAYRYGDYAAALDHLRKAIPPAQGTAARSDGEATVWTKLFLAMAEHRFGQTDEARRWLTLAEQHIENDKQFRLAWTDRLIPQLLMAEARQLMRLPSESTSPAAPAPIPASWLAEERQLAGLNGPVIAVALSPRNDVVAAVSEAGQVRVWRTSDGLTLQQLEFPHGKPAASAFSADGKFLAVGGERGAALWTTDSWQAKEVAAWKTLYGDAQVTFLTSHSHFASIVTCGGASDSWLWFDREGIRTGGGVMLRGRQPAYSAAQRRDRKQWAFGIQNDVVLLNQDVTERTESAATRQELTGHAAPVVSLAYSSNLQYLASGSRDRSIRLWNAVDGSLLTTAQKASEIVGLAFSADCRNLLAVCRDGEIATYAVPSMVKKHSRVLGPNIENLGLATLAEGKTLATASSDGLVRMWRWEPDLPAGPSEPPAEALPPMVAGEPASAPIAVKNWIELRRKLTGLRNDVVAIAFSPDGKHVAAADGIGKVIVWNIDGPEYEEITFRQGKPTCLAFLKKERTVVVGGADGLTIYDLAGRTDTEVGAWKELKRTNVVRTPKSIMSGDATFSVAADAAGWIEFSNTGNVIRNSWQQRMPDHIVSLAANERQTVVAAGGESQVLINRGGNLEISRAHNGDVNHILITDDGKWLVTASRASVDKQLQIWSLTWPRLKSKPDATERTPSAVTSLEFANEIPAVLVSTGKAIIAYSAPGLKEIEQFQPPAGKSIYAMALSEDDRLIATGGPLGEINVWDLNPRALVKPGPTLLKPAPDATLDNGRVDRSKSRVWEFAWTEVPGATHYHLHVELSSAPIPVINIETLTATSYRDESDSWTGSTQGWRWKVRAKTASGMWTAWSKEQAFGVVPPQ